MRLLVAKEPLWRILRWTRRFLFVCAASLLAYCGFVVLDAWNFQRGERREFERSLANSPEARGAFRQAASSTPSGALPLAAGLIGRLDIPRLGLSAILMEGTTAKTLRRAVGHIAGTALPGLPGNVGLSGHRDTFFRPLRNIRENDIITLTTVNGEYRYRVVFTRVVRPDNVAMLKPTGSEVLTLVTCFPFYLVGPAPYRFIVRAERAG
jgi:sortase A